MRGTRDRPAAAGTVTDHATAASSGSAIRQLQARFAYAGEMFDVDARLDQAPGVWITASARCRSA